jgi:hypothetical protein
MPRYVDPQTTYTIPSANHTSAGDAVYTRAGGRPAVGGAASATAAVLSGALTKG